MSEWGTHATPVRVRTRPRWRLRLELHLLRWVLVAAACAGLLAAARVTVFPPRPIRDVEPPSPSLDPAVAGFATLFARAYLDWTADDPAAQQRALAPFLATEVDPGAGFTPSASGTQQVLWTQVVQQRDVGASERVDTLAVETDRLGLIYLTVDVTRESNGRLALARYPGIVGAPATAPSSMNADAALAPVRDGPLATVVQRALGNYLDGDAGDLAADLAPTARVALPAPRLTLTGVSSLRWGHPGESVFAQVQASDPSGASYTLEYEVDVESLDGRWVVLAIGVDPDGSLS
ncbi:MAG TPA: conjugal transfer protein [Solirubrobacteraceae bacterium]|jgi:hypothetical protein|nr:conjugal transfer protein [Solirubrobacteraceae bacterium]